MKHTAETPDFKKLFPAVFGISLLCIFAGFIISFRTTGGLFSEGVGVVRNITFQKTSYMQAISDGIYIHFLYCATVLIFALGIPGAFIPGICIGIKSFFLGVTVGLAARSCVFGKAAAICFAAFISNILIIPLYITLFFIALNFSAKVFFGGLSPGKLAKGYLSFSAKVFTVFLLLCLAECVQSALGVFVLKTAIKVRY